MFLTIGLISYFISMVATFICINKKKNPSSFEVAIVIVLGLIGVVFVGKEFLFPSPQTTRIVNNITANTDAVSDEADTKDSVDPLLVNSPTLAYVQGESGLSQDCLERISEEIDVSEADILMYRDYLNAIFPSDTGWEITDVSTKDMFNAAFMAPIGFDWTDVEDYMLDSPEYSSSEMYTFITVLHMELISDGNPNGFVMLDVRTSDSRMVATYNMLYFSAEGIGDLSPEGINIRIR